MGTPIQLDDLVIIDTKKCLLLFYTFERGFVVLSRFVETFVVSIRAKVKPELDRVWYRVIIISRQFRDPFHHVRISQRLRVV